LPPRTSLARRAWRLSPAHAREARPSNGPSATGAGARELNDAARSVRNIETSIGRHSRSSTEAARARIPASDVKRQRPVALGSDGSVTRGLLCGCDEHLGRDAGPPPCAASVTAAGVAVPNELSAAAEAPHPRDAGPGSVTGKRRAMPG
jgi:hypothetical protein